MSREATVPSSSSSSFSTMDGNVATVTTATTAAATTTPSSSKTNGHDVLAPSSTTSSAPRRRAGVKHPQSNGSQPLEIKGNEDESKPKHTLPNEVLDPHAIEVGDNDEYVMTSAIFGIIKGMVGPAILYLPHGFATCGYAIALPILFITTALYLYSSQCLLVAWKKVKLQQQPLSDDMAEDHDDIFTSNNSSLDDEEQQGLLISSPDSQQQQQQNVTYRRRKQQQQQQQQDQLKHNPVSLNRKKRTDSSTETPDFDGTLSHELDEYADDDESGGVPSIANNSSPSISPSTNSIILSYPELAFRALGRRGEIAVKLGIALMQSGVCLTYLIFVPHNLFISMKTLLNESPLTTQQWLVVMVILQIPLSWIQDIRKLTCTNVMANILILYGLVLCLGFALEELSLDNGGVAVGSEILASGTPVIVSSSPEDTIHVAGNDVTARLLSSANSTGPESSYPLFLRHLWIRLMELDAFQNRWYLFIGTSVLLFEGSITLLIPLQESVMSSSHQQRVPPPHVTFPIVYRRVILSIIGFYIIFGMICWASFGDNVHTVLTTSLPAHNLWATSVQLAYSWAVMFTFPLQNFPALEIVTSQFKNICHSTTTRMRLILSLMRRRSAGIPMTTTSSVNGGTITTGLPSSNETTGSCASSSASSSCASSSTTCSSDGAGAISSSSSVVSGSSVTPLSAKALLQQRAQRNVIATCMVILLGIVAATCMNSLDKVVSLMGSLLGCPIAFVFPPLIHTQLCGPLTESRKRMNTFVASAGVVVMICASIVTIITW